MDRSDPLIHQPFQGAVSLHTAKWLWPALAVLALGALGFVAALAVEISEGDVFRLDSAILLALRRPGDLARPIGPAWMLQSATDISALGGFTLQWLLGTAAVVYLLLIRRRAEALWLVGAVLGASIIDATLKSVLHRARPEVVPHLAVVSNASFPSGHAMISAAILLTVGAMLSETHPRRTVRAFLMGFCALLVLLIGFSRLYLGVHWPSDVLAGWCLGSVWALLAFLAQRLHRRMRSGEPRQNRSR